MKLLYITNGINGAGGLERVLSIKASYLVDHFGYEVTILVLNDQDKDCFYKFSDKIKTISIQVAGNPIQYFKSYRNGIKRIVKLVDPDIISVCDDGLKGFFIPSVLNTNAKIIYERHASISLNTDLSIKGRMIRSLMQNRSVAFDRFVVLTEQNAIEWNGAKVQVLPNPLSFYPTISSTLDQNRVVVVGSHSYNKGFDKLIDIWERLSRQFPDWQLHIFGKFDKEMIFVKLAEQRQLVNCHFFPPTREIESQYLHSTLLFLPSRSEGFGMVLIEAMACGVPCVAFDCPSGPRDIISDTVDGYLVDNQNVEMFVRQASELMDNFEKRMEMGIKARENISIYRVDQIMKNWNNLFRELVK